jgi:hypothetical protein
MPELLVNFDDRSRVSFHLGFCAGNSRTAQCEAA